MHSNVIKLLLGYQTNPNLKTINGFNALIQICEYDRINLHAIKLLLKTNIDINAQTNKGKTALILVSENRNNEKAYNIAKLLLKKGANPHLKTNKGFTASELTKNKSIYRLIQYFILKKENELLRTSLTLHPESELVLSLREEFYKKLNNQPNNFL